MEFGEYIKTELFVLIPVLYAIGLGLKKSNIKDKYIPLLLGVIGIVLSGIYVLSTETFATGQEIAAGIFTAIIQGVLCASASVYANQTFKQVRNEE